MIGFYVGVAAFFLFVAGGLLVLGMNLSQPKAGRHRGRRKLRRPSADRLGDYAYEDPTDWVESLHEDAEAEQWMEYRGALIERYRERTSEPSTAIYGDFSTFLIEDDDEPRIPTVRWDPRYPQPTVDTPTSAETERILSRIRREDGWLRKQEQHEGSE